MQWRIVSGLFLGLLLFLLAVEFSEDLGLFGYGDPGVDQSLDVTLASLGDAIQPDDHHHPLKEESIVQWFLFFQGENGHRFVR